MQTPSGDWAGSEPPVLGALAAGVALAVGWAAACFSWAAACCSAAFFLASRTAASRARYWRRLARALSRTFRDATWWRTSIIISSLPRLDAALVTEIFAWELVDAAEPDPPPDKNRKAAATP